MIEFVERYTPDGYMLVSMKADRLPAGMYCKLTVRPDGWTEMKTRANGNGSIRYRSLRTYSEARVAAIKWAGRKIREARAEARKRESILDAFLETTVDTYLSHSNGMWRVIHRGMPICADMKRRYEAERAAEQFHLPLTSDYYWDGDANRWTKLPESM